jgi:hypothetical protein
LALPTTTAYGKRKKKKKSVDKLVFGLNKVVFFLVLQTPCDLWFESSPPRGIDRETFKSTLQVFMMFFFCHRIAKPILVNKIFHR